MRTYRAVKYRYMGHLTKDRREKLVLPCALFFLLLLMPGMFMFIMDNRPQSADESNSASSHSQPEPAPGAPSESEPAVETPSRTKPPNSLVTSRPTGPTKVADLTRRRPVQPADFKGLNRSGISLDAFDGLQGPIFHVVSHTHWDREWYLPFESFRGRLVKLIDRIFETMARDDNFRHFHFDGQFIPIEDYLEIRPSMRDTVIRANLEGKISLGPWYIQPDEYLVSAEALVRNLLIGMRLSNELGGTVKLGYVPDSFGHISQLPQLLRGFGINNFISGRGPVSRQAKPESIWRGPDGSEVLFIYLKAWYCNALDMPADQQNERAIQKYLNKKQQELSQSATKHTLLMNGCDHSSPDPRIGSTIASITKRNVLKEGQRVLHTDLETYVKFVEKELDATGRSNSLPEYKGELRAEVDHLAGTLSTKISQKQMNWALQNLLELWAEPLSVYTEWLGGEPYDQETLTYAWKKLLQNHPHDSICGCSSQEVHREVDTRFAKVKQVVEGLLNERALKLAALLRKGYKGTVTRAANDRVVAVFNPTNAWRQEVVVADVMLGGLQRPPIARDAQGRSVSTTMLSASRSVWSYVLPDIGFRKPQTTNRAVIAFYATVPPLGYALYSIGEASGTDGNDGNARLGFDGSRKLRTVEDGGAFANTPQRGSGNSRSLKSHDDPRGGKRIPGLHTADAREGKNIPGLHNPGRSNRGRTRGAGVVGRRHRSEEEAMAGEHTIENEYMEVSIYKDGSVDVKDKATGLVHSDLNILFDEGDSGDEYKFARSGPVSVASGRKVAEPVHSSTGQVCHVTATVGGTLLDIFFLLSKGSRRLEVRVEMDNTKNSHRVRAQFHVLGESNPHIYADGQFEVQSLPQYRFATLLEQNEKLGGGVAAGLTIATRGLHEYTYQNSGGVGCYHVTLIRSPSNAVCSTGKLGDWMKVSPVPTAQEQGKHAFEYAIIPHARAIFPDAPGVDRSTLPQQAQFDLDGVARGFNFRLHAVQADGFSGFVPEPQINIWRSEVRAFADLARRASSNRNFLSQPGSEVGSAPTNNRRNRGRHGGGSMTYADTEGEYNEMLGDANPPSLAAGSNVRSVHLLPQGCSVANHLCSLLSPCRPPSLVISAIKKSEGEGSGTIVRFYNPYSQSVTASIGSSKLGVKKAWLTNLAEERVQPLSRGTGSGFVVEVGPKKIITVELIG